MKKKISINRKKLNSGKFKVSKAKNLSNFDRIFSTNEWLDELLYQIIINTLNKGGDGEISNI